MNEKIGRCNDCTAPQTEVNMLSRHILELQKDKGELIDKVRDLEEKLANADYQLEGRDLEIKELEAQIEKMKCCGNCGNEKCTSKYRGNSAYHRQSDGYACADNEDWIMRRK